ncbi:MAG: OmpA family protein [Deltaproteobacteria bacterium]|nr:OmpA family protein [Deltaproteobacteria bacterium]
MSRLAIGLALLAAPGLATAQESSSPPVEGAFGVQNFNPAPGPQNFLSVEGARVSARSSYSLGLTLNYASDPFVVFAATCPSQPDLPRGEECPGEYELDEDHPIQVVSNQFTGDLVGTFVPIRNLQIGLDLPVTFVEGNQVDLETGTEGGALSAAGLGDPRLMGKYRFVGNGTGVGVAGSLSISIPAAEIFGQDPEENHLGSDLPTVVPRVIVDFRRDRFELATNLSGNIRSSATLYSTDVGVGLGYGLAAGYQFDARFRALAEVFGTATFSSEVDENPLEADAAIQARVQDFLFTVGGGGGVLRGVGVPDFRVIGGVLYSPVRGDVDGDGIDDRLDHCVGDPEDSDGFQDDDGCPETDNDEDGFPDGSDRCPNDPEDRDNHLDRDGCPDLDNDGDGVQDGYDSCPDQPEDRDGDRDDDGCPDNDTDGDNIPDAQDRCPAEIEDTDGFEDEDGCPEADNDHDCVLDEQDQCSDQPEDGDGFEDEDGCPDDDNDGDQINDATDKCPSLPGREEWQGCPTRNAMRDALRAPPPPPAPRVCGSPAAATPAPPPPPAVPAPAPSPPPAGAVEIEPNRLRVEGVINFRPNRTEIMPDSLPLLDQVASVMLSHPEVARVRIEGHTDNSGPRAQNLRLSAGRARAVREYLVEKGVAADRLEAEGIGPDRPVDTNETDTGRAANRRVEFNITQ